MSERISQDKMLMLIAGTVAMRSTCSRLPTGVGAVIARDGRVISTGYNGVPSGMEHCNHECDCDFVHEKNCASGPCMGAVHAEQNAIAFAAKYGLSTNGASLYCTLAPCLGCAKLVINSGISKVLYRSTYRDDAGCRLLIDAGIEVKQFIL